MRLLAIGGGITVLVVIVLVLLWPSGSEKAGKSNDTLNLTEAKGEAPKVPSSLNKAKNYPSLRTSKQPTLVPQVTIDAGTNLVNVSHTTQADDSLTVAFQSEERDVKVAPGREQEIRVVVEKLQEDLASTTSLSSIDCRSRHCRLELGGEIKSMMPILDALQDERGMMGHAESMMFTRENEGIQIYLRYPELSESNAKPLSVNN